MDWHNADDVLDFTSALAQTAIYSVAAMRLALKEVRKAVDRRTERRPRRESWPYRLVTGDMTAYRQATAVRRYFGSADTPMLRSGGELTEWRHRVATLNAFQGVQRVWDTIPLLLAFTTLIVYNAMPSSPSSEGLYWGGLTGCLAAALTERRFVKRLNEREGANHCLWRCTTALRTCYEAARRDRGEGPLAIDAAITRLCSELGEYVRYWESDDWRSDMSGHVARVQNALRESAGAVLREGHQSLPETVRLLGTLLDRLMSERWLSLLDEEDMPDYEGGLIMPVSHQRRDYWVGGLSLLAMLTLIAGALFLGDLSGAGQVLPFLILPILLLGTDHLRTRVLTAFRTATPQP